MAEDLNKVVLVGRLTKSAENKVTKKGCSIVTFTLAVNKSKKIDDKWTEEADFIDMTYFGKRAEGVAPYLMQGTQVAIDGRLDQQKWSDENGNNRSKVCVLVNSLQLLAKPKGTGQNNGKPVESAPRQDNYDFKDQIPF